MEPILKNTEIGKACGIFVIKTLNKLIEGENFDIQEKIKDLKKLCVKYDIGVSTGAIIEEAKRREIPVSLVNNGELVRLGYGKYQKSISSTLYEGTSNIAVDAACNKDLTRSLLAEVSIPVPKGKSVSEIEEAILMAEEIGYPVVLKPKSGNKGKFVFVNIQDEDGLKAAFLQAVTFDGEVIVEKYIEGKDFRVLVVNGQVIAESERVPAHVIVNGLHSIRELITTENQNVLQGEDHEKPLTNIIIDDSIKTVLAKQGMLNKERRRNMKVNTTQLNRIIKISRLSIARLGKKFMAAICAAYFVLITAMPAFAAPSVSDSKIAKGTEKLIQDVTTWLMVLAP